jgi:hypothetical protein
MRTAFRIDLSTPPYHPPMPLPYRPNLAVIPSAYATQAQKPTRLFPTPRMALPCKPGEGVEGYCDCCMVRQIPHAGRKKASSSMGLRVVWCGWERMRDDLRRGKGCRRLRTLGILVVGTAGLGKAEVCLENVGALVGGKRFGPWKGGVREGFG